MTKVDLLKSKDHLREQSTPIHLLCVIYSGNQISNWWICTQVRPTGAVVSLLLSLLIKLEQTSVVEGAER